MGNKCSCQYFGCGSPGMEKLNLPKKEELSERPKPDTEVDPKNLDTLAITSWNWEIERNGYEHHTQEFTHMKDWSEKTPAASAAESKKGTKCLVIRRGQSFQLTLDTNIPYDSQKHELSLVFLVADASENFGNGTQVGIRVNSEEEIEGWIAKIHNQDEKSITLEVMTSAQSIVGEWKIEIDIDSSGKLHSFSAPKKFYILYNPWCKDDAVYLENDEECKEYVLSDTGLIWRGTHSRLRPCLWQYGQFEKDILECVLHVLNHLCRVRPAHRADPIRVARAISAGVNSPDDSGVLVGNWSGKYTGGRAPTHWRDSIAILQQYYVKKKSVKYGQCWVFSAVVTTAARALGIPCRPVTNFLSAHDTHNSLTIDNFFDEAGVPMKELNADSVWNFHVWNEVWMTRPDLGSDYSGWQVIDATPQEESDGQFRCGPSSLVAIKSGEIHRPYDTPFVYAEVNADTLFWKYQGKKQPMKLLGRKTGGVGLNISTKAVGKMRRDDITYLYKHKEESEEERKVMEEALRRCHNTFARYYLNEKFEDVEFHLHLKDDIVIGKPFKVRTSVENKNDSEHEVSVLLRVDAMLYTGAIKDNVKKHESKLILKPQSKQLVELEVKFEEYYNKLADQCSFNISCLGKIAQNDFEYFAQDDFRVRKPDIKVECLSESVEVGKTSSWRASFENPLPKKLTKGKFYIRPSKLDSIFIRFKKAVEIGETASVEFNLTPKSLGEMTIGVIFNSKELDDVDGFTTMSISEVSSSPKNEDLPEKANGDEKPLDDPKEK